MRGVMAALEKLPAGAWLTRGTWERLTRGESKPGARLTRRGPSGVVLPGVQVLDAEVVDFEDLPRQGMMVVGETRRWVVAVRVVYDSAGTGRLATRLGEVVWREVAIETREDEVPFLMAQFDADGRWANAAAPEWRVGPQANPGEGLVGPVEQVVAVVNPGPVVRGAPTFFARL